MTKHKLSEIEHIVPLSIPQLQQGLTDRKLGRVAEATGVSFPTLQRLLAGETDKFNYTTILKVSKYLREVQVEGIS